MTSSPMLALTISNEIVTVGLLTGLAYALLACGLVLVYRGSGVVNFAHGEIGAFCAAVLAKAVIDWNVPFAVALVGVTVLGGAIGGVVELAVVRRLFEGPRLILLVATIGVSQLLFLAQLLLPRLEGIGAFPSPIDRSAEFGTLLLRSEHFMVMAVVPAVVASLALFLTRTPYGIAIRASAENADAASLAGISPRRISTLVWVIAGALAAITVVLINPLRGTIAGSPMPVLGPSLLLRALAAGLIGRLVSLPKALIGGLAIGVLEALLFVNFGNPGAADAALFLIVLGTLLAQRVGTVEASAAGFTSLPRPPLLPERLRSTPVRALRRPVIIGTSILVAVIVPYVWSSPDDIFLLSRMLVLAVAAIGLTLLIGWAGQLSLGHFAFVGLGSVVTAALVERGIGFPGAVGFAMVAGVVAGVIVGTPALRLRGLLLAVTTLAFATAANSWLFSLEFLSGDGTALTVPRAVVLGFDLSSQRAYYFFCLAVLVVVALAVGRLRTTGIGRSILAVRDNEARASSLTLSPTAAKLTAFGLSAGIASLSGALLAGLRVQFGPNVFGPEQSLELVAMVIIGGVGMVGGAILGTLYVVGLPTILGNSVEIALLTSGAGLLLLLLYLPGGLLAAAHRCQEIVLGWLDTRFGTDPEPPTTVRTVHLDVAERPAVDGVVLAARGVGVHLGGRSILDDVSLEVHAGETLGLIGSNGAGKSTLMGALSGFVPLRSGTVELFGRDVTSTAPHERARSGMGRIFQDARLFGDLTVRESLQVALESRHRSELIPALLALPPSTRSERRTRAEADDVISLLGLGRYADHRIATLSTGSRRIVELGCLVAQQARVLLLDEPTAGVAQREAEAFGPLVGRIRQELDATVVIIEHDLPLVTSMSDRLVCMSAGEVIAEGAPKDVTTDPAVVAAYLGTDERAISRSDATSEVPA